MLDEDLETERGGGQIDGIGMTKTIDGLWAILSIDADGNEGLVAAPMTLMGNPMPLLGADEARRDYIVSVAKRQSAPGSSFRLVRFGERTETDADLSFHDDRKRFIIPTRPPHAFNGGRIDHIWVVVAVKPTGDEGFVTTDMIHPLMGRRLQVMLVATDDKRRDDIVRLARSKRMPTGHEMRLVRLGGRVDVEDVRAQQSSLL